VEESCPSIWRTAVRRDGEALSAYEEFLLSLDSRPHRSLRLLDVPALVTTMTPIPPSLSDIARHDVLGGLIHEYRAAA
jgi:hypothetical protein